MGHSELARSVDRGIPKRTDSADAGVAKPDERDAVV